LFITTLANRANRFETSFMSETPLATLVNGADVVITTDVSCMICGYNLRGLMPGKVCPECGTPIARSLHGNLLRYADPQWLGKLLLGVRLTLWSILIMFAVAIIGSIAAAAMSGRAALLIVSIAAMIGHGFGLWAIFLITTPEPRIAFLEDTVTLRKAVRVCAVAEFLGEGIKNIGPFLIKEVVATTAGGVLSLVGLISTIGMFVYLRRFARRIPDPKLVKSTTTVMWGFVITLGIALVGGMVVALASGVFSVGAAGAPATPPASSGLIVIAIVAGVGFLVFGIWYLVILFDYRNAFRKAATQALRVTIHRPMANSPW